MFQWVFFNEFLLKIRMDRAKQIYLILIFCSSWTKSHFWHCSFFLTAQKLHCRPSYQVHAELLQEKLSWELNPHHQKNLLFKGNQNKSKDSWLWARKHIGRAVAALPYITQVNSAAIVPVVFCKVARYRERNEMNKLVTIWWLNYSEVIHNQKAYTIFIDSLPTIWKRCWW